MQRVGTGCKLIRCNPLGQSILRGKVGGQDLDFAYHLEGRVNIALQSLRFGLYGYNAVKDYLVFKIYPAIYAMAEFSTLYAGCEEKVVVNLPVAGPYVARASTNQNGNFIHQLIFDDGA